SLPTCASRASWSTATTRATCCRSSRSRSATAPRCSSRSSSATARAASATATSRRCSRRSSASRPSAATCRPPEETSAMRYVTLGEVPPKRHAQFWRGENGDRRLLVEEVLGYEGFSGNESILYHLHSPCRLDQVGGFRPLVRAEWVADAHVHRLADTRPIEPGGDPLTGRRLLMWNADIEVSVCKPTEAMEGFHRNGEGDEFAYVPRGAGVLRTMFGPVSYREKDYVVIPRGTTHRWEPADGVEQHWMCFHTPGEIETPNRYRNRYGQLLEHAPFSQRDFHPPAALETIDETGEWTVTLRVRDGLKTSVLDRHPFDIVGVHGYVYPYTFNAADFEPHTGRFHLPPPAHQ